MILLISAGKRGDRVLGKEEESSRRKQFCTHNTTFIYSSKINQSSTVQGQIQTQERPPPQLFIQPEVEGSQGQGRDQATGREVLGLKEMKRCKLTCRRVACSEAVTSLLVLLSANKCCQSSDQGIH